MGILKSIGSAFKAIAAVFGFAQQRDAEKNSATMQANAGAKTDAQIKTDATAAVAKDDLAEIQKEASE